MNQDLEPTNDSNQQETQSSLDDQLPIQTTAYTPLSYRRSRLFTTDHALNPLVGAAMPVLSLAMRLPLLPESDTIHAINNFLIHEIQAFESQAKKAGIAYNILLPARYCLCAYLDDQIRQSPLDRHWPEENRLLQYFHNDTTQEDQLVAVAQRCLHEPTHYIDLLELIYLILSLGYEGPWNETVAQYKQLQQLMDQLYHQIRTLRGPQSHNLHIKKDNRV